MKNSRQKAVSSRKWKNVGRRVRPLAETRRPLDYYCLRPSAYCLLPSAFCLLSRGRLLAVGLPALALAVRLLVGMWGGVFLRALAVEVAFDCVEDAVDELRGLVGGEAAGDLQRLVDGDGAWRRLVEELVDGHAQDVAVNDGHAR